MAREFTVGASVDIDMGANPITNVADPTNDQDAATKKYVDDNGGSISVTDGSTTVDPATSLDFTSGATVTDGGGGVAEVAVTSSFDLPGTIHAATGKTTPVDNDELALVDSAASNVLKKLLWSNVKATLKAYFDTLYASSSGSAPIGTPELIYRYTVTGSDKASIDTGADTPDAGSNDWSNGDVLEVYLYSRTDEAVINSGIVVLFDNASGAVYDRVFHRGVNATASAGNTLGDTNYDLFTAGASAASGVFGSVELTIPNYMSTVGNKVGKAQVVFPAQAAADITVLDGGFGYRSTSALARISFAPLTSGKKFKVGTQLLIYKRRAS